MTQTHGRNDHSACTVKGSSCTVGRKSFRGTGAPAKTHRCAIFRPAACCRDPRCTRFAPARPFMLTAMHVRSLPSLTAACAALDKPDRRKVPLRSFVLPHPPCQASASAWMTELVQPPPPIAAQVTLQIKLIRELGYKPSGSARLLFVFLHYQWSSVTHL